jgi:cell division septum initiation protein DivIVA
MKKVYLLNGEEVELLSKFNDGKRNYYVVKVVVGENCYQKESGEECELICELIYENKIVDNVYEKYEDIPEFLRKTKLEKEVEELKNEVRKLKEQKEKIEKELKSVYSPQFKIGTPIYTMLYGKVKESKIKAIVFTEKENDCFYEYYYENYDYPFQVIGKSIFLTKEEAEMARQEYLENKKIEEQKIIEENYKRAKEEYEKLKRSLKKQIHDTAGKN